MMASRMAKKKTKARPERGRRGQMEKYHSSYTERVKMMIVDLGAVNSRGEIAWSRIAKLLGVSVETLRRWRKRSGPYYKQDFAIAVTQAVEEFDTDRIKAGQIIQSQKHILHRVFRELRVRGPQMPSSDYNKALLIRYADVVLKLSLNMKMTIPEMRYRLERRVEELTKEELVIVRKVSIEVDPHPAAVKLVLMNLGKKEERWTFTERHEVERDDALTRMLAEIGEQPVRLPREELSDDVKNDNERAVKQEFKEPYWRLRAAINSKCLDCSNWQATQIKDCSVPNCPLYEYRPSESNLARQEGHTAIATERTALEGAMTSGAAI